jgi:lysozyme
MGMIITKEQGDIMFAKELGCYEAAVEKLVKVELNQNQFDALCSYTYNCGPGALEKSSLLQELNKGNYKAVPGQLMRWTKAGGKVWPGLVRRRQAEGALFLEPMKEEKDTFAIPAADPPDDSQDTLPDDHMPQQVSETTGSVSDAAKQSWTIRGAVAGLIGGIIQFWDWLFSTAKDAGTEIIALKTASSPFEALWVSMKMNLAVIAAGLVIAGCVIAIVRRLQAAHQQKVG